MVSDFDWTGTYVDNKHKDGYLFSMVTILDKNGALRGGYNYEEQFTNYQLAGDKGPKDKYSFLNKEEGFNEWRKIRLNSTAFKKCDNYSMCKENYLFNLNEERFII